MLTLGCQCTTCWWPCSWYSREMCLQWRTHSFWFPPPTIPPQSGWWSHPPPPPPWCTCFQPGTLCTVFFRYDNTVTICDRDVDGATSPIRCRIFLVFLLWLASLLWLRRVLWSRQKSVTLCLMTTIVLLWMLISWEIYHIDLENK